jgi:hypothetical protein
MTDTQRGKIVSCRAGRPEVGEKLKKYTGLPITLTAPTWVTVGPTDFWNRNDGTTNFCGALSNQPCALSNAGVFATGLTGKTPLDFWIPKRLGNWYVKYGFELPYYERRLAGRTGDHGRCPAAFRT